MTIEIKSDTLCKNGHNKNIIFLLLLYKYGIFMCIYTLTAVIKKTQNQLIRLWHSKIKKYFKIMYIFLK